VNQKTEPDLRTSAKEWCSECGGEGEQGCYTMVGECAEWTTWPCWVCVEHRPRPDGHGDAMTRAQAKRTVCHAMAVTLHRDLHELGAEWIFGGDDADRSKDDVRRLVAAAKELVRELDKRGGLDPRAPFVPGPETKGVTMGDTKSFQHAAKGSATS